MPFSEVRSTLDDVNLTELMLLPVFQVPPDVPNPLKIKT